MLLIIANRSSYVAFESDSNVALSADKFCHKLKLIQLAASLGSAETIIAPTQTFFGLDLNADDRAGVGINTHTLRLSVGVEDPTDLITDLKQALG